MEKEEQRKHIAIVDDNPVNLDLAESVLREEYKVTKLISGEQLLKLLLRVKPDMILLDIQMPGIDGYQTMRTIRENPAWKNIPIIFVTGQRDIASEREGFRLGAKDFITKPFDPAVMQSRIRSQLELYQYQTELEELINQKTKEIEELQHVITVGWAEAIESRDGTTGSHVRNTTRYYGVFLQILSTLPSYKAQLLPGVVEDLMRASAMHDIGKIGISDIVLKKPGPLNAEEFSQMRLHSRIGADMIQKIIDSSHLNEFLFYAREMALSHHERWDGTGYPCGLKGEAIPFYVQALSIVDVFDALTSVRPYKRAFTYEETMEIMHRDREKFYSPELFDIFESNGEALRYALETKE